MYERPAIDGRSWRQRRRVDIENGELVADSRARFRNIRVKEVQQ